MSQVQKVKHGVPTYMSVASFAAVAPLLLMLYRCWTVRVLSKIQRKCALELSLVVFEMVRPHNVHIRAGTEASFVAVTK